MNDSATLPENWAEVFLEDVYTLHYGKALPKRARTDGGSYPVLGSSGVVGIHAEFLVEGPVVIVGRKGAAGAVVHCKENCWPIDTTYFVKPPEGIDARFAYYHLEALQLNRLEKSTAIPGLSRDDAYALRVAIPPTREQRRIVAKIEELFSELDKGVESLTITREQLKAYRQSVLKHAFEGKLTEAWRKQRSGELVSSVDLRVCLATDRQAYHERLLGDWKRKLEEWKAAGSKGPKPSRVRSLIPVAPLSRDILETLPILPDGWVWEKLGWMTCGVDYGTAAKSAKTGTLPVIRMGNLQNGRIDWSDLVYTDDPDEIEQYQLQPGDVLFNRTNSPELVGKTARYLGERPAVFAGYLIRINHNALVVDSQYLNLFLNSSIARQYGNRVKTDGVNQSNINGEKLQNYPFPFCLLAEQHEIVRLLDEKLSRCDHLISEIEEHLQRANALRQAILARAFSGRLVTHDPMDEPASVLLERIRAERAVKTTKKEHPTKNGRKKAA
jgi:type I restriction enzyme S subunit